MVVTVGDLIINRPKEVDLSSSMDEYSTRVDMASNILAPRVDQQEANIGVYFMKEELLNKISKSHA